jgi:hypothetical protein
MIKPSMSASERFEHVFQFLERTSGIKDGLQFDQSAFLSEKETADHNYALVRRRLRRHDRRCMLPSAIAVDFSFGARRASGLLHEGHGRDRQRAGGAAMRERRSPAHCLRACLCAQAENLDQTIELYFQVRALAAVRRPPLARTAHTGCAPALLVQREHGHARRHGGDAG